MHANKVTAKSAPRLKLALFGRSQARYPWLANNEVVTPLHLNRCVRCVSGTSDDNVDSGGKKVKIENLSPLYQFGGVHGTVQNKANTNWRNKPLFRRLGDVKFRTGDEAASMLLREASRRDPNEKAFLETLEHILPNLAPLLERTPRVSEYRGRKQPGKMKFMVGWVVSVVHGSSSV